MTADDAAAHLSADDFDAVVAEALELIPERFQPAVRQVALIVEDEPPADQPRTLLGLYEGVPLTSRDDGWFGSLPDRITLFQGPLERSSVDLDTLRHDIAVTVVHEVGHLFGLDDDRLHELGWG